MTLDASISPVVQAFSNGGVLQRAAPYFKSRQHQIDFALAVEQIIQTPQGKLVVEAGTGTGKTYAYLVPVLLSGRKAIISTATKGLQDQLFLRDLPHVRNALQLPSTLALLKGRSNYLCLYRLEIAQTGSFTYTAREQRDLSQVILWAQGTQTGDVAEMAVLDERSPILPIVTSTRENCLGSECPKYKECYLMQARKAAMAADVVVVNHHLFFADLAVRESGVAELLPTADVVVFDEAHQLNDAGLQFLGVAWTSKQMLDFARDMLASGLMFARTACDWSALASECEKSTKDLQLLTSKLPMNARLTWEGRAPEQVDEKEWLAAVGQVEKNLQKANDVLESVAEGRPDLSRLQQRAELLLERLDNFNHAKDPKHIRWVEPGASLRLIESPLDIAQAMQERCFEGGQSWVFTSATLGDDDALSWFTKQTGISHATVNRFDSPFDYENQAAIYVPENFPRPNDPDHLYAVAHLAARLVAQAGGRAFILTTTLRALGVIGDELERYFSEQGKDIQVLVQGTKPRRELIEQFRQNAQNSVLVGSQSFWGGIDVAGDDLQLVIIDKLPFPPPNDPLVQARSKRIEEEGGNSFTGVSIPEAAITLKQGAGRLIRRETDRGVLVICDPRLALMGYGKRLMAALPPMQRVRTFEMAMAYIEDLKKRPHVEEHEGESKGSISS